MQQRENEPRREKSTHNECKTRGLIATRVFQITQRCGSEYEQ